VIVELVWDDVDGAFEGPTVEEDVRLVAGAADAIRRIRSLDYRTVVVSNQPGAAKGKVSHEVRVTVLGHLQRGGSPSAFDRLLGTRFGVKAALLCAEGRTGRMVSLRGQDIVSVPLEDVVGRPKLVSGNGELVTTARHVGIELGAPG